MSFFLPHLCPLCLQKCPPKIFLCDACQDTLSTHQSACQQCGQSLTGTEICGQCLKKSPIFDRLYAAFWYQDAIQKLILGFKFHHNFLYGKILSSALIRRITTAYLAENQPEVLIPIPLHWRRQFRRGYNQSILIGQQLEQDLSIPMDTQLCHRHRPTQRQTDLPYLNRQRNVEKAFIAKIHGYQHIALIDDVVTSGCTANSLAQELKKQGAKRIDIWCLARA